LFVFNTVYLLNYSLRLCGFAWKMFLAKTLSR